MVLLARWAAGFLCSSSLVLAPPAQDTAARLTSPTEFLGQPVGADHFLADYTQLLGYWRKLATESDRMAVEEIGTTSYGQTMVMAVVSSPQNLAVRERYRRLAEALCRARDVDESQARELSREGKAVVWIDGGLHATESVAAQNILELVWQMVSRDDAEVRRILDNVLLLVCPANPDGMEMVARGYMASKQVGRLPVLYQRYVGHDNNRDFYMANMPETQAINRVLYRQWYPQIVYNHHQTAPRGTVIFTPPFRDPFNYNIDPMVVRGIDLVSAHMNARFAAESKPGVISRGGASYSTWWNGGLRTTAYFHNMIGILTESFGSPNPSRIEQRLDRRLPSGDYPMPIASQTWHARQTIDYLQTANFAILDLAARYRQELLFNIWRMGKNGIERGSRDHWTPTPKLLVEARERQAVANAAPPAQAESAAGGEAWPASAPPPPAFEDPALRDPRAWVLPADQPDFAAATRLVRALQRGGVEVHRATAPFTAAGARCPSGSWVVQAAQAFRGHAMDMLEPQWHPDDTTSSGDPVRPYDSAGWTPALTMGVQLVRVRDALEGPFELVSEDVVDPPGTVVPGAAGYLLDPRDSNSHAAVNRLLAARETLHALAEPVERAGVRYPAGSVFVRRGSVTTDRATELAAELGVDFTGLDAAPPLREQPLVRLRIGLFDVYGGNMATGWTEWVLRQYGYPVELVFGNRVHRGDLRDDFDVLLFHTGLPTAGRAQGTRQALRSGRGRAVRADDRRVVAAAMPAFEDWSTVEARAERLTAEQAIPALRAFVEAGGTLLAFGGQATSVARHFVLPVREGVQVEDEDEDGGLRRARRSEFFVPTSVLAARATAGHPLSLGVPAALPVVYRRSPAFVVEPGGEQIETVVEYSDEGLLSGWAVGVERLAGKAAVLSVPFGAGRVHLFGADVVFRGQPVASFKLVFNALLQAASVPQR